MEGFEGIELRDFAVEAAEREAAEHADREFLKKLRGEGSRLKRFWASHVRITITEAESRDHLALERTFLAYIRTSTAYAQLGVTIAQLFRLNTDNIDAVTSTTLRVGKALGATTEGIALIILLLGAAYFAKQQIGLLHGTIIGRGYEVPIMLFLSFALLVILLSLQAAANLW